MTLDDWQKRLHEHFAALGRQRATSVAGSSRPIFALEHGLTVNEIAELGALVRAHIRSSSPEDDHSLAWVVYAAELGYRYSGDEYWQTFAEETPGWQSRGDRYWVRDHCYREFHRKYNGAKPSGPWADHFSIICWPITHAILPKDLQRQLARILFELRHSYSAELFESPVRLGEFIAARSWNATSRFQQLTEEPHLIGQIATALLLQGEQASQNLILPATLRRITEDLDQERRARDWLREAQRFARQRAQVRGLAFGRTTSHAIIRTDQARAEVAALGIEPRLILQPADIAGRQWSVSLEVPDLSSLLFRFPSVRKTLTESRSTIAGSGGRPLARERFLHGPQRVPLQRWPKPDEVLIKFERQDPQLDFLLKTECLLRPGPNWLFRIATDGFAYELRSLRVRAGERYILVTTGGTISAGEHVSEIKIACDGISGVLIDVPSAVDSTLEDRLRRLGLSQAKKIEVWPAGLAAVSWDGDGHGEWLASERACLGVSSDHPIGSLVVSLQGDAGSSLELKGVSPGETTFIELPTLPVGLHRVRVSTRDETGALEPLGDLDVMMRIRESRPWSPAASAQGPLLVEVDPPAPSLEQLWEGHVRVSIDGPTGRQLRLRLSLFESEDSAPIANSMLPALVLPIEPEEWERHIEQHFRKKPSVRSAYDTAKVCTIEFAAEELGAFTLRCQRDLTAVRWALRRTDGKSVVRLIDDTGEPGTPTVTRFSFGTPAVQERLDSMESYEVAAAGGLYVGRREAVTTGLIVSPEVRTLADLGVVPNVGGFQRSTSSVVRLIDIFGLWARARLSADLVAVMRQNIVLRAIAAEISRLICGDGWSHVEKLVTTSNISLADCMRAISRQAEHTGFLRALEAEWSDLLAADCGARATRLTRLVERWCIVTDGAPRLVGAQKTSTPKRDDALTMVGLALRTASDPAALIPADDAVRSGISRLISGSLLARTARMLVLHVDRQRTSTIVPGRAYAGWDWQ